MLLVSLVKGSFYDSGGYVAGHTHVGANVPIHTSLIPFTLLTIHTYRIPGGVTHLFLRAARAALHWVQSSA